MAKKTIITWNNPDPNTNLDHLEIWRKTGVDGTYAQIGADITGITAGEPMEFEDTNGGLGLANGQEYFYQVRSYNATGGFSFIEGDITIAVGDITAPTWITAEFNVGDIASNIVVLPVSEGLDLASVPALSAFTVDVDGLGVAVTAISLATPNQVRLTIASLVPFGATVAVDYLPPMTNPIRDVAENNIAALSNVTVENTVPEGEDVYDFVSAASQNEVAGSAGFAIFSGTTVAASSEEALDGTQSVKIAATGAGGVAVFNPLAYLDLGGMYDFTFNHKTVITSATSRTFSTSFGMWPKLEFAITQSPSQWREEVMADICCMTKFKADARIGIGDSGSNIYFDRIKIVKIGQLVNTGSNLFDANDAAGVNDSNLVSSGWGSNLNDPPTVESSDAYAGTRSIKLTKTGTSFASANYWIFTVEAATFYKVSFYYKTVTVTDGTPKLQARGNMVSIGTNIQTFTTAAGWRLCEFILKSTTVGQGGFAIELGNAAVTGTVFLIDDVQIYKQTL